LLAVPKEIDLCILAGGVEHWLEEVENYILTLGCQTLRVYCNGFRKVLMQKLLQWSTLCGYKTLWMEIRKDNLAMLRLAKAFWFEVSSSEEDMVYVQKNLAEELPQLFA